MTVATSGERVDAQSLAATLAPALISACDGRLRDLSWFRADWQRGGAATAHAVFDHETEGPCPVVVKVPVGDAELRWTQRLQTTEGEPVVPRLFASGDTLAGFDFGWIIVEQLPHGPLGAHWDDSVIPRMAHAAARFHAATRVHPIDRCPAREDWPGLLEAVRQILQDNPLPDQQRWVAAIKQVQSRVDWLARTWNERLIDGWIHGDLHPANAMCRSKAPDAPVTLIDLAEVRPGHWVEDAIYLERLHWARPERMRSAKPLKELAAARRMLGLPVEDGYQRLATVRRILLAATAPRFMRTEGNPAHLSACLQRIESGLNDLKSGGLESPVAPARGHS